ncbi:TetR family transcriptional regulator C-terminal domain-containing protein [Aestuariibaculum suncheonense]|uniref:TetR/AcrR family transcriptional regulator n=1 Tax=Aestuariibaculum suncheonense TaxID=1028745 RepID=A0A8J6Q502_9FLAO|nr:TetR family transcriptional regulator C-terminal domain-containing protein [Aestuariibaculum suncheonense]MBD0835193.1 TetR/AcrR family transcriptional regulator [Aestuariibaculum suncheonense]
MAKKKSLSKTYILSHYMNYVLEHNERPKTIFSFCKTIDTEESKFYEFFGSFDGLEKDIFNQFLLNTISLLEKDTNFNSFESRNKLLSFYYTFFEILTANRSFVAFVLNGFKTDLKRLKVLSTLRQSFIEFIESLNIETIETKQKDVDKFQQKAITESAWLQLLITIEFWLKDSSAKFEKTDIFIEKSVNTSFDIINTTPIKSIIDLGKFLFKEKVQMS